jgi:putative DNA primase/helicase
MSYEISPELAFALSFLNIENTNEKYGVSNGILHKWTGLYWKPINQDDLEKEAWKWLAENMQDRATPKASVAAAAAVLLQAEKVPSRDDEKCLLPVKNGTIELAKTGIVLRESRQEDGLCHIIDCEYDVNASAPLFWKFLHDVLPDVDVQQYVQEYIGYTLIGDCRFEKSMFWVGGGSNGKSTLGKITAALHRSVSAMQLDRLEGFALAGLIGASLVIVDETPKKINEQELKKIISGNLIQIERKYRDPLSFKSTAKWLMFGNGLPAIRDQTHGFWRKFCIVKFERQFSEDEKDVTLTKKIIEGELAGVLNWALDGLASLMARGRFPDLPQKMAEAQDSGKKETNSVLGFVSDKEIECEEGASISKEAVYSEYQSWCKNNGIAPVNSHRFWSRIHELFPMLEETQPRIDGRRVRKVNLNLDDSSDSNVQQQGGSRR